MKKRCCIMYRDTESGEILSREDLRKEYEDLYNKKETETPTFWKYLRNCLDKNGTLEEIPCKQ